MLSILMWIFGISIVVGVIGATVVWATGRMVGSVFGEGLPEVVVFVVLAVGTALVLGGLMLLRAGVKWIIGL